MTKPPPTPQPFGITTILVPGLLLLIGEVLVIFFVYGSAQTNDNAIKEGNLFAVISGSALGIERVIEIGWIIIGLTIGPWWPVETVSSRITSLVTNTDTLLQPFQARVKAQIATWKASGGDRLQQVDLAEQALAGMMAALTSIESGVNSQQLQVYVSNAVASATELQQMINTSEQGIMVADHALDTLASVVASFKDRPARRLISLLAGVFLGILVATGMNFNIFATIDAGSALYRIWGVIMTGIVLGFGANPTHQIIQFLQDITDKSPMGRISNS